MPRVARLIHQCYSFVVSLIGWLANLEGRGGGSGRWRKEVSRREEVPGGGGR